MPQTVFSAIRLSRIISFVMLVNLLALNSCNTQSRVEDSLMSLSLLLPGQNWTLEQSRQGTLCEEKRLAGDAIKTKTLMVFLTADHRQWKRSWNTYAPELVLHSEGLHLNFQGELLIMNLRRRNGSFEQVTGRSSIAEVTALVDALRR